MYGYQSTVRAVGASSCRYSNCTGTGTVVIKYSSSLDYLSIPIQYRYSYDTIHNINGFWALD